MTTTPIAADLRADWRNDFALQDEEAMSDKQRCDNCRHWKPAVSEETGRPMPRSRPGDCEYPVVWPENLPCAYANQERRAIKTHVWFDDGLRCKCYEPKSKQSPQKQEVLNL